MVNGFVSAIFIKTINCVGEPPCLPSFKVCLCVIVLSVQVCTVGYVFVYFVGIKFLRILLVSYPQ